MVVGFVLRDSWGRESVHRLYPENNNASFMLDGCGPRPVRTMVREPIGGAWSLETQGEYEGSVRVVVVAFGDA